jgi:hypothetical protein
MHSGDVTMFSRLAMVLALAAGAATAQTSQTVDSSLPASCKGLTRQMKGLQQADQHASLDDLEKMQERSRSCLEQLLAGLPETRREAAHGALGVYRAVGAEAEQQIRQGAAATARAENEEEMKHVAGQTAGLFARLGELTYRYNEFLKQVSERQEQENTSQADSPSPAKSAAPLELPPKAEMLDCHDFRIGRFDACWPPDYD